MNHHEGSTLGAPDKCSILETPIFLIREFSDTISEWPYSSVTNLRSTKVYFDKKKNWRASVTRGEEKESSGVGEPAVNTSPHLIMPANPWGGPVGLDII